MHRKSVYLLVVAVAILIVIGCVMLFSTSPFAVREKIDDPAKFIKLQAVWLSVGAVVCLVAANINYNLWRRAWPALFLFSLVLLALCFVPGIGKQTNGSSRWLNLRVATFQPSELAKLATIAAIAAWYGRKDVDPKTFLRGFVAPIALTALPLALIAPEVDIGTTALLGATMLTMMFVAGARLYFLAPMLMAGCAGTLLIAIKMKERLGRLLAFMDLEKYRLGAGLQQWRAQIAFITGGEDGLGLGNGRQKMGYLPEAHTDFIFSMVGEELGLRFTLVIILCYIVIILCGVLIAMNARDRFGMLLGFGIVVIIGLQAIVNIGVNISLLPNKGMPLPFVSYGGSNLVFCLLCVGILINIYRQGLTEKEAQRGTVLRARTRVRRLAVRL